MTTDFANLSRAALGSLLSRYGLSLSSTKTGSLFDRVLFQNSTTGLLIEYDHLDGVVTTKIYRLVEGKMPEYGSVLDSDRDLSNGFNVDDLIQLRRPDLMIAQKIPLRGENQVTLVLQQQSAVLSEIGDDVLSGDFGVFPQLADLSQRRRNKGPA